MWKTCWYHVDNLSVTVPEKLTEPEAASGTRFDRRSATRDRQAVARFSTSPSTRRASLDSWGGSGIITPSPARVPAMSRKLAGPALPDGLKRRTRRIVAGLARLYPDAHCALHYENPLQLLAATILSAPS